MMLFIFYLLKCKININNEYKSRIPWQAFKMKRCYTILTIIKSINIDNLIDALSA